MQEVAEVVHIRELQVQVVLAEVVLVKIMIWSRWKCRCWNC
jgi:hypothetical protein